MTKVILVTAKWCVWCPETKKFWRELQKQYKFDYEEIDIESDKGKQLTDRYMIEAVPTTIINGQVRFVGMPDKSEAIKTIKGE